MTRKPKPPLKGLERTQLLDALYAKYAHRTGYTQRFVYLRKKYSWVFVIVGTKLLKRIIDISIASMMLIILSPIMLLTALLIKLTDGGPVLYITKRVGKWGKEFNFPKFRSMQKNADQRKEELTVLSHHKDTRTFKIKKDPRITWIGRLIRKTSIDELPQLWCVLKGDMALVGPRPPLINEVQNYTVDERRRLDITPGLTCIWQVSGRSDIPFPKQVSLDLQYIESQSFWLDMKILLQTIPAVIFGRGAY